MKRGSILLYLFCCVTAVVAQQKVSKVLIKQRQMFPQEKVYVMTDRDLYIAGDTVWMRPWIYDCNSRKALSKSKYVYIELRDAADNLMRRVKIINRDGKMNGYMPLSPELMSGDYTLCAYTYYMTGTTDEMFFKKRLHIMKSSDVAIGLFPTNLNDKGRKEALRHNTLINGTTSPIAVSDFNMPLDDMEDVAVSITNDLLCLSDSSSNIVWSLKAQPPLFTTEGIRAAGVLYSPTVPYEIGQTISGTVYGNFSTKKPQRDIKMSFMVPSRNIFDVQTTDSIGHFTFQGFNLPDSTLVYLAGKKGKHTTMDNITMDNDSLPEQIHPLAATPHYFRRSKDPNTDFKIVGSTIDLANTQLLDELIVKGKDRREKPGDEYDNTAAQTMKESDFKSLGCYDVRSALMVMPGLTERGSVFYYRDKPVSVFVDGILETDNSTAGANNGDDDSEADMAMESPAMNYPIEIVQRIDLLRTEDAAFLNGNSGNGNPAICITLKEGADISKYSDSSVKAIYPLGYQKHKGFIPHDASKPWPVIYWNPNVNIKDGKTLAEIVKNVLTEDRFSDGKSRYTIHIDGFTTTSTSMMPVHIQLTFDRYK